MNILLTSRSFFLKSVDALLFLGGAFLLGSGLALELRLPRGKGGHGVEILGLGRHDWGELHWWVGLGMGILVCVHLALHWKWIRRTVAAAKLKLGLWGVLVGLILLLLPLLAPVSRG